MVTSPSATVILVSAPGEERWASLFRSRFEAAVKTRRTAPDLVVESWGADQLATEAPGLGERDEPVALLLLLTDRLTTFLRANRSSIAATRRNVLRFRVRKVPRIGIVSTFSLEHPQARELSDAFRQGLRQLGYVEGRNIVIESRSAQGRVERVADAFAELVRLNVELILSLGGTPAAPAAKQANNRDLDRCAWHGRSCWRWGYRQPRATGREYHGVDLSRAGVSSETHRAPQGEVIR